METVCPLKPVVHSVSLNCVMSYVHYGHMNILRCLTYSFEYSMWNNFKAQGFDFNFESLHVIILTVVSMCFLFLKETAEMFVCITTNKT